MTFWLLAALMLAAGIALLAVPVLVSRSPAGGDAARLDQLRRLGELEQDLATGEIDPAVSAEVRRELERSLLDNVGPAIVTADSLRQRPGRAAMLAVCLFVPLLAIGVYLQTGSPHVGAFAAKHPGLALASPAATVELLLEELRRRVRSVPDDGEAWSLLARANMQLERFEEAARAAEASYRLAPRDPAAILLLVDALAMSQGGRIDARAAALIDEVLAIDAAHTTAQVLKGILAQQAGEHDAALQWWRRALAGLGPESPLRADLEQMLGDAAGSGSGAAATPALSVRVDVSLDPALAGRARPDDTVFVFARAVDGPPAPLAVSRHSGADLPLTVTFDESMAMVPGASLADFPKVYVVARVSRAGAVQAASGDLEGRSAEFAPGANVTTAVTIDRVLP